MTWRSSRGVSGGRGILRDTVASNNIYVLRLFELYELGRNSSSAVIATANCVNARDNLICV